MKKLRNWLNFSVLIVYTLMAIHWVFPLVEYTINKGYIASFLCIKKEVKENNCAGKCYLNKKLSKKINPDSQRSEDRPISTQIMDILAHLTPENISEEFLTDAQILFKTTGSLTPQCYLAPTAPPPKQA